MPDIKIIDDEVYLKLDDHEAARSRWELDYSLLYADYKQLGIEITNYREKEKALLKYAHELDDSGYSGEMIRRILNCEQEKQP